MTIFGSSNVVVWRSLRGAAEMFAGTWSGGWPAWGDLEPVAFANPVIGTALTVTNMIRRDNACLLYTAATRTSSSPGDPSFTLARTRNQLG